MPTSCAGLRLRDETHEPVENLQLVSSDLAIGDKAYLLGDGNEFHGTIFEFVDDGMVAGLKDLSAKLVGLGCGWELPTGIARAIPCGTHGLPADPCGSGLSMCVSRS